MSDPTKAPPNEKDLLLATIETPTDRRSDYLNAACGSDIELKARVNDLLKNAQSDSSFMASPAIDINRTTAMSSVAVGGQVGRYRLMEQIGEGGMGVVYVAEQLEPVRRKVALKVIKPGMDSKQVIARFDAERQALAMMDHSNIARVFDAGTTDQGLPYFVMELVRGMSITKYCDQAKLSTNERLALFIDVCGAVQHAHQKGIIHRDIKPGNVLVTLHDGKPVVKVIDFGVAKAIHQQLSNHSVYTALNQVVGTPLYISPEQLELSGLDIDTRSDIYSLGVLLYELLTGDTPFDRERLLQSGFDEMRRIIREEDPPRPSHRVTTMPKAELSTVANKRGLDARTFTKSVQSELDWISLKALEKDRTRRYESASAMAKDTQRYLDGDAVQACPPSTLYRARKFARRNKAWITTAAIVMVALVVGTGVASWQALRATAAEQLAVAEQENSQRNLEAAMDAIEQLLFHVGNRELADVPAVQSIRKNILIDSLDFYERFSQNSGQSDRIEYRAARVFKELGHLAKQSEELTQAEEAFLKALNIADSLVRRSPRRIDYLAFQAELNGALCQHYMHLRSGEGAYDQAVAHTKIAEQQFRVLSQMDPANKHYRLSRVNRLRQLAVLFQRKDPSDPRVSEAANQALNQMDKSFVDPGLFRIFASMNEKTNPDLAGDFYHRALEATRKKLDDTHHARYIHAWMCDEAAKFFRSRDKDQSETLWKESAEILIELTQGFPEFPKYQDMLHRVVLRYADLLETSVRDTEMLLQLKEWSERCPTLHVIHAGRLKKGDPRLALTVLTDAIAEYPEQFEYRLALAELYVGQGADEKALTELNAEIARSGTRSYKLYQCRGDLFIRAKRYADAGDDYTKYLELREAGHIRKRRAEAYFYLNDFQNCISDMKQSVMSRPTDLTNMSWIPLADIVACTDISFRAAYRELADQVVNLNQRSVEALSMRALIACEFGNWEQARLDLAEAIAGGDVDAFTLYQAALLSLATGRESEFRATCERQLVDFRESDSAISYGFVAWTAALAPEAIEDFGSAIQLARRAVAKEPTNQQYILSLGAILMRGGQLDEAKEQLEKALQAASVETPHMAYANYFLALTEAQLTHRDLSNQYLEAANECSAKLFTGTIAWNRKLTLEVLRQEAESLFSKTDM